MMYDMNNMTYRIQGYLTILYSSDFAFPIEKEVKVP